MTETVTRSGIPDCTDPVWPADPGWDKNLRPKKYQRIGQMMIRPLVLQKETSAFDLARLFYAQYSDLNFENDLVDYMRNGYVITRPHLFAMFRPILHDGERIWFVRVLIGSLLEAVACMPVMLPKVAFCRNNQPDAMVVCNFERLIDIAKGIAKRNENTQ